MAAYFLMQTRHGHGDRNSWGFELFIFLFLQLGTTAIFILGTLLHK